MKRRSGVDVAKENILCERMTKNISCSISWGLIVASQGYLQNNRGHILGHIYSHHQGPCLLSWFNSIQVEIIDYNNDNLCDVLFIHAPALTVVYLK